MFLDKDANYIAEEQVWEKIVKELGYGLEPFVYAVCHAESNSMPTRSLLWQRNDAVD